MNEEYTPGQRWLSDADPELGLGVVTEVDGRHVRLDFPACGENRLYARASAPLSRLILQANDPLKDQSGSAYVVQSISEEDGLLVYAVKSDDGQLSQLPEGMINHHFRPNRPQEKLFAGRFESDSWFSLRYQSWMQIARDARSSVFGLAGARVDLIPHQLYIAAEAASRHAPRLLLADEVGLGKTIEAGLILHRMLLTERIKRVLIVVPEPLLHQWLVEMLRRFNLHFSLFDLQRFTESESTNPFMEAQCVLCSLEFLTGSSSVARAALAADWDMLVVDEAHHLHWTEASSSIEYELISELATTALGVLLLTATPEQLGQAGHFARLRILDPHRYHDYQVFLQEEKNYQPIAEVASRLLDDEKLTDKDRKLLATLPGDLAQLWGDDLIDRLLDQHGVGRVLFRNTRAAIKGFPQRVLLAEALPLPEIYQNTELSPEQSIFPEAQATKWVDHDPRIAWLVAKLQQLGDEKVLVICALAETVTTLKSVLQQRYAIGSAIFHEGMEIVERDRAAAYFADKEEGAQILLCSEIGSEGRNFQFAHHLVLFDLPLEADLLEQRIGRLDRIGQTEDIKLHVPYFAQGAQAVLFRWYAEALDAFSSTNSVASAMYEQHATRLLELLQDDSGLDEFIQQAIIVRKQMEKNLESGRDRLLELHSHRPEVAAALVADIMQREAATEVKLFMHKYWDLFGVEHEGGPGISEILRPGRHMHHEYFPGLPSMGATVTFHRSDALAHEDRLFLTWEHPMVRGAMDMLAAGDQGSVAVTVLEESDFPAGSLLLELVYLAECTAPSALEAGRFMPPTAIRLLLDKQGKNLAAEYSHQALQGVNLARDKKTAKAVIKSLETLLRTLLKHGEAVAEKVASALSTAAQESMHKALGAEKQRLQQLAEHNPNVRDDEVQFAAMRMQMLEEYLQQTSVRLDAIRLIVCR